MSTQVSVVVVCCGEDPFIFVVALPTETILHNKFEEQLPLTTILVLVMTEARSKIYERRVTIL